VPLYVHASTNRPASTSHLTILAVSSNCLVPSARMVGASGWAPTPVVFCGNALIERAIAASISSDDIGMVDGVAVAVDAAAAVPPVAFTTCSVAFMPDCSWPGTWQTTVYVPGASPSRVRLPTPPASTIGLASLVSLTARLWAIEPMFMICNVPPAAIVIVDGSIVNSDRWTMAVDGGDDS